MIRVGHDDARFFSGVEVEHTRAFGMQTLFVVGVQSIEDITHQLAQRPGMFEHVYFGANMSFPKLEVDDAAGWTPWERMIKRLLDQGYLCTLDIDVSCVEGLLESGLTENHNFIPMISVKLPYIQQLGFNAIIKLDDKDFAATNPGVWCHSLHELTNPVLAGRNTFTSWDKYTKDEIL